MGNPEQPFATNLLNFGWHSETAFGHHEISYTLSRTHHQHCCCGTNDRIYTEADNKRILYLLDSTHHELVKLVRTISETDFFFRIDSNTWSPNDIIEHLGLIDEGYVRELWFALSQPSFPDSYLDSTRGGDAKAIAYATQPEKGKARGTNLPRDRYCNKETCVRIFTDANDLAKEFYRKNAGKDLRRFYIFRVDGRGGRTIRDLHQLGLLLIAHRIRHINQLKEIAGIP